MFLHNYAEWQRAINISSPFLIGGSGTTANCVLTSLKGLNGDLSNKYLCGVNAPYGMFSYSNWGPAINRALVFADSLSLRVGSGTTDVDPGDYKLDVDETSKFIQTVFNKNIGVSEDGHLTVTITWTGTNNTSSAVTIKEIGLVKILPMFVASTIGQSQIGSIDYQNILIARYILPDPVTINPGDSGTLSARIEMF